MIQMAVAEKIRTWAPQKYHPEYMNKNEIMALMQIINAGIPNIVNLSGK
jgi:hypothetical protein